MDTHLIGKIIRLSTPNSGTEVDTENPLLDPESCRALSVGLVRLLRISSDAAPRARIALLNNIRALTTHAHAHHEITEDLLQILTEYYTNLSTRQREHRCDTLEDEMSSFLAAKLQNIKLKKQVDETSVCLARALLNTNPQNPYIEFVTKKFLMHNENDKSVRKFLQEIWDNNLFTNEEILDKVAVRVKPDIERTLLNSSYNIIINKDISEELCSKPIKNLISKSAKSSICFQTCCSILNSLFKLSNYNLKLQTFTVQFTESVKLSSNNFIGLYDADVQCLAMMLSYNKEMKTEFAMTDRIVQQLKELGDLSEEKLIMLMSHYPYWFNYISEQNIVFT